LMLKTVNKRLEGQFFQSLQPAISYSRLAGDGAGAGKNKVEVK
jgi:hypothetical protein